MLPLCILKLITVKWISAVEAQAWSSEDTQVTYLWCINSQKCVRFYAENIKVFFQIVYQVVSVIIYQIQLQCVYNKMKVVWSNKLCSLIYLFLRPGSVVNIDKTVLTSIVKYLQNLSCCSSIDIYLGGGLENRTIIE